jgi:hypothetical protein
LEGWFKFERVWLENGVIMQDGDSIRVWLSLNAMAAFEPRQAIFRGEAVTLQPGQLITGRKKLASLCGVQESKITRILQRFRDADLITQRTTNQNRLITLAVWDSDTSLNSKRTTTEQQMNNERTADEQQMNTYKELKNDKKERAKNTRASARKPPFHQSIFSADASYDLADFERRAIGLRPCDRKADA